MKVSNSTSTHSGEQLLQQIILKPIDLHKYRSFGPEKSGWMQAQYMDLQRNEIVITRPISRTQQAGSTERQLF